MSSIRPRLSAAAILFFCSAACLPLPGCSGPAPPPLPRAKESALSWNRRGLAAEARGDADGAIIAFREALKTHRSVEDGDGAAAALVNLARVHRLKEEPGAARERIDEALLLVPPDSPLFPEAAFEKAKVSLAAGDLPAARDWARKAALAATGPSRGRFLNLLARVDFLRGAAGEARSGAEAALAANRSAGARAEEANSLRLLGDLSSAGGDRKGAERLYLEALAIDKEIAESRKIAADLMALGAAAAAGGETERALAFYGRAAEVSRNGDDPKGVDAARREMERLKGAPSR
jgi:tetratricopeptide (TPR) repeat protein